MAGVPELRNRAADGNSSGHRWSNHDHAVAAAGSGTSTSGGSTSAGRSPTGHIDVAQWFNNHPDFASAATTLSEAGASRSGAVTNLATTTTDPTAGVGAKAFALVADPRILIFDEATSALDYESERAIQQNMKQIAAGRTVFIIAHRLSTVRTADRIITLEAGRVVEDGSHDDLLHSNGRYAKLHFLQAGILGVR